MEPLVDVYSFSTLRLPKDGGNDHPVFRRLDIRNLSKVAKFDNKKTIFVRLFDSAPHKR